MDASKAFDKINHFHLMSKLIERGVPIIIVRLLYFWCISQEFVVRWGSTLSKSFRVSNGVHQGGIASPAYFNVYLDNLSVILSNANCGCSINSCCVNHLFYADDSVLIAPSPRALQRLIDICVDYAGNFELTFNIKKTKVMCFKPKGLKKLRVPEFYINGSVLEIVSTYKYLGVIIDDLYSDNDDILRQTRCIYARGNILIKKFSMCNVEVKARLFKAYCSSFYCSQLWCSYSTACFRKLQASYNRIFRVLFKLDRLCSISQKCIEYNIDSFKVLLRKSIFGFRTRLLNCDNTIIQSITRSTFYMSCSLTAKWNHLLFTFDM
jgi:hypothetical protein